MTLAQFRKLNLRDFENGATLNDIEQVFKERDKLLEHVAYLQEAVAQAQYYREEADTERDALSARVTALEGERDRLAQLVADYLHDDSVRVQEAGKFDEVCSCENCNAARLILLRATTPKVGG